MQPSSARSGFRLFLAALAPLASLGAQTAPASRSAAAPADEAVQLSPFVVATEKDTGYVATSTLAGSRLNTELIDTPAAISVFTRDFLEDIGAINVNQAFEYALNGSNDLVEATGNNIVGNDFNYNIRGFRFASAGRNYFGWALSSDSFNIERLDFSRGPNSILFGVGGPGGIVNTTTKQALFTRPITQVSLRLASWDDYRASFDLNRRINNQVAVRLNVVRQDAEGYRKWEMTERTGAALAVTWRPWRRTTVRLDTEYGDVTQNKVRPWAAYDGYASWVNGGRQISPTFGTSVTGSGTLGAGIMYLPLSGYGTQAVSLPTFRRSTNGNLPGMNSPANITDESIHPRRANVTGPGAITEFDYRTASVFLEQQVGDRLFLEAAFSHQGEDRTAVAPLNFGRMRLEYDINAVLPAFNSAGVQTGFAPNPNVGKSYVEGGSTSSATDRTQNDLRFTASYILKAGKLGEHRIAGLVSRVDGGRTSIGYGEANLAPGRASPDYRNTANSIRRFTYLDLHSSNPALLGAHDPAQYAIPAGVVAGLGTPLQAGTYTRSWSDTFNRTDTGMLATQSYFWSNRVVALLGFRRDSVRSFNSVEQVDPVTQDRLGASRDNVADVDETGDTRTMGLVFHATKWLTVYGNRSENFQAQPGATLFGIEGALPLAGNVKGRGQDLGMKLRLFDQKLHVSAAWFSTEETARRTSVNGLYAIYIEGMWDAMGRTIDINGGDTRSTESDGYELDVTANLTRNWRLSLNASRTRTAESGLMSNVKAYVAANRATWAASSSAVVNTTRFPGSGTTVGATLPLLDLQIAADAATEGQMPKRHREYNANLFTNYRFSQSWLRGWSAGGGLQYRGEPVAGYNTVTGKVVTTPAYILGNAMLSYERKLWHGKVQWRTQLNIDNVLDYDKIQVVDSAFVSATQTLSTLTYYFLPRRYALTMRFDF